MEFVYHIVAIRVNETSWAHVWRLRSRYLGMGYDMYFDGSYTIKEVGAGVVIIPLEGDILKCVIQLEFPATNNIAKYGGLVTGFQLAKGLGIQ
jgi:hypothetical protein